MSRAADDLIRQHRHTVDEYHRMGEAGILREDDRVELIEGVIVDMAPIGSRHAAAVARLDRLLARTVGDAAIVWVQNPIILGQDSEPQPDLALLHPRDDFYSRCHPGPRDVLLLVEVSDTTARYDREVKVPLYARRGIPEVWIVDLEKECLTTYSNPRLEEYELVATPDDLTRVVVPGMGGVTEDISELFSA